MYVHASIMLLAGVGVPLLAALNAALGQRLGSPSAAALVLFGAAFTLTGIIWLCLGAGHMARLASAPKHLFLGSLFLVFYLLSVTYIAPHFGVGNAVFCVLLGQLISASAIDHFGLFGAMSSPITLSRATGLAIMATGVWITLRA